VTEEERPIRSRASFDETGRPIEEDPYGEEPYGEEPVKERARFSESGQALEEEEEEQEQPRHEHALVCLVRKAKAEPEGALVLFHGRGTDEHDLFPLLEILDPDRRLLGITPRAPIEFESGACHWYLSKEVGYPDAPTFNRTYAHLQGFLDLVSEDMGIPADRMTLGGFSQGAVMAYALALGAGRPQPPALIALSGFIPTVDGFELDLSDRSGLSVAIGHGINDRVIPPQWSRQARRQLEEAGAEVVYRESRMPHAVDPRFLYELPDVLYAAIERTPALRSEG
jgi:phospholipase/carboxylesterase